MPRPLLADLSRLFVFAVLAILTGCSGGLSARTAKMRSALDAGRVGDAIAHVNDELAVARSEDLPKKLVSDNALLVLDRATLQQAKTRFALSKRDYEAADKAIDVLDLSHGTADDIGRYAFKGDAGRYVAPAREKVLLNALNMLNYLETRDLNGARVEARRVVVTSRFLRERHGEARERSLGFASLLAGFTFEKSGELDEARRFYEDAVEVDASLAPHWGRDVPPGHAELLLVVGDGRVPHRVAEREPVGLALTRAAPYLAGGQREQTAKLEAQGLVTWVVYPSLAPPRARGPAPTATIDGKGAPLVEVLDVERLVRDEWKEIEGKVMAAAVSRALVRFALGKAVEAAGGKGKGKGIALLASLVLQAAMTAADTPDTRSWETLPARLSFARVVVPAGQHVVTLDAGGMRREQRVNVPEGGFGAISLLALR